MTSSAICEYADCRKTDHQQAVEKLLLGIGRTIPSTPTAADQGLLRTQLMLQFEETFEMAEAMGLEVHFDPCANRHELMGIKDLQLVPVGTPDVVEIADAGADLMVIATGALSLCGIADLALLREVNENNILKINTGRLCSITGKFLKAPDHPRPDIKKVLQAQGWSA